MTTALPGDIIDLPNTSLAAVKVGPGLRQPPSSSSTASTSSLLYVSRPGLVGHLAGKRAARGGREDMDVDASADVKGKAKAKGADAYWIEGEPKRYVPAVGDSVVGQVTHRSAENYLLALGSAHSASLPALAFEGATKRNRPNLKVGALVYARVSAASRHTEPEVTCVDPVTGKAEGFGELKVPEREEGHCMAFECSLNLAKSLLRPTHPLLPSIASHFSFEAAVGHNGIVWVRASTPSQVIAFGRILAAADELPVAAAEDAVQRIDVRGALDAKEVARLVSVHAS